MSSCTIVPCFSYDYPVGELGRTPEDIQTSIRIFIQEVLYRMPYREGPLVSGLSAMKDLLAKDRFLPEKLPMHLTLIKEQIVDLFCLCKEEDFRWLYSISLPSGCENLFQVVLMVKRELRMEQINNPLTRDMVRYEICKELIGLKEFSRGIKVAAKTEHSFQRSKTLQTICSELLKEDYFLEALDVAEMIPSSFIQDCCFSEIALLFGSRKNWIRAFEIASKINSPSLQKQILQTFPQKLS